MCRGNAGRTRCKPRYSLSKSLSTKQVRSKNAHKHSTFVKSMKATSTYMQRNTLRIATAMK